jgi:isoleucyl-tRNA synthetase
MAGSDLVGRRYEPLFPYFKHLAGDADGGAFVVVSDGYVTDDSGTGVVHQAPAFGEDDHRVCLANGVVGKGEGLPCPVDLSGRFTDEVPDFAGVHVKDADKPIIAAIKAAGRLVDHAALVHSYPYCWRSDTPLIYRAVPSWFVAVEAIKDRLLANNALTYWVPAYVKEKRFHNWLEGAHDWAVSRSRCVLLLGW